MSFADVGVEAGGYRLCTHRCTAGGRRGQDRGPQHLAAGLRPDTARPGGDDLPGIIVLIILVAIFAPVFAAITGHGVNQQFRTTGLTPDGLPVGPNRTFLFGTDDQGRDILVRLAYGTRISLGVGVGATILVVIIGAVLGLAAGYLSGIVDTVVARLVDVVLSLPYLLFAISLVSISGPEPQDHHHRDRHLRLGGGVPNRTRPGPVDS